MSEIRFDKNNKNVTSQESKPLSFISSQMLLLQSRKKWGIIYTLATVAGIFCAPGGIFSIANDIGIPTIVMRAIPLPMASFMIIVGMYVLNDLIDANLDKANGKRRPIPSGQVSIKQAWAFVMLTNGIGIILAAITFNTASLLIALIIAAIGLMYSAPKISLKDKFIVKTLAIAFALVLCGIMGASTTFGSHTSKDDLVLPIYASLMLGMMVFITSPINDLGDIAGDKLAGRRTIPIVIGGKNTVKAAILLTILMVVISWSLYETSEIGLITTMLVSCVSAFTCVNMTRILNKLDNLEFVRKQHKKSLPLHVMLQLALIAGSLLI